MYMERSLLSRGIESFLLLLFVLFALARVRADPDYCPFNDLTCQNGAIVNNSLCQPYVNCPLPQSWDIQQICSCTPGFSGSDCSIISDPKQCPNTQRLDSTFLNTNNSKKHVECFLDNTPSQEYFSVRQHRINVTIDAKRGTFVFDLTTRHMNDNITDPNDPRINQCAQLTHDVTCRASSCSGKNIGSDQVEYTCNQVSCSSCPVEMGCSPLLDAVMKAIQPPISLIFSSIDEKKGIAHVSLKTNGPILEAHCSTGMCVDSIHTNPQSSMGWVLYIIIAVGGLLVIVTLACLGRGLCSGASRLSMGPSMSSSALHTQIPVAGDLSEPISTKVATADENMAISVSSVDEKQNLSPNLRSNNANVMQAGTQQATSTGHGPILLTEEPSSPAGPTDDINSPDYFNLAQRYTLAFDNVSYSISKKRSLFSKLFDCKRTNLPGARDRQVLKGVSGVIHPGELVAILGPSGSGKSTLMDILGDRRRNGTRGFVGLDADGKCFTKRREIVRYVLQDDRMLPTQTVREAILFSAKLRLPKGTPADIIDRKVDQVLDELMLTKIAKCRIGSSEGGGISGGERRRVAIGIELVTDPLVLLLDEPTSGLDSHSAALVIQILRSTANRYRACLCTIHQPPSKVFDMFDSILLLGCHGEEVYFGPPNQVMSFINQFSANLAQMNMWQNVPEYLLDILSNTPEPLLDVLSLGFKRSEMGKATKKETMAIIRHYQETCSSSERKAPARRSRPGFITQFYELCLRTSRHVAREPSLLSMQLLVTVGVAALLGFVFWRMNNLLDGIQNRTGVLFFMTIYFSLISMSSLGVLVNDRLVFMRERDSKMYSPFAYFLSQLTCELIPLRIVPPLIFGSISYFMMGLHPSVLRFVNFLVILILINVVATSACLVISAAIHDVSQANLVASLFFIFSMLFGGLFLNNNSVTTRLVVLQYLSFIHYGYEGLMIGEFLDLTLTFNPSGFSPTQINGRVILDNFAMKVHMAVWDKLILFLAAIVLNVIAYLFLKLYRGKYQK